MRATVAMVMAGVAVAVVGCSAKPQAEGGGRPQVGTSTQSVGAAPRSSAPSDNVNLDPCWSRLHDLCAPLLLYYSQKQALPESLDELARVPGFQDVELSCPVSKQKYAYNPHGPTGRDSRSRIIVYDPAPHDGRRWGISVQEPAPGQALVVKAVAVPESLFGRPSPR